MAPPAGSVAPPSIPGAAGPPLALSVFGPGDPDAVIVGVHGYGDHAASTFAAAARAWARHGIRTYAYDQRGFGRNASRGRWPGAAVLIADLAAVVGHVRRRHPGLPLVVVGHSMGGGVALAAGPQLAADGLVLAAPAIWGGSALNPLHRGLAWLAAATVPDRRFSGEGFVEIRASDNDRVLRALARDPLYLSPPSPREMMGLVRVMDRAAEAAPRTALPAMLLTGAHDEILPVAAVRRMFARLPGPRSSIHYSDGWHLVFRDRQAPRVWHDVAEWVLARPPPVMTADSG